MECAQVEREDIIERYLIARLRPGELEAFEEHYFECPRCFEALETYRALQAELGEASAAIRAEPLAERPAWRRAWAAGLAVVVVVFGLALWLRRAAPEVQPAPPVAVAPAPEEPGQVPEAGTPLEPELPQPEPSPPQVPSLSELARIEPPFYTPPTLRGVADEAALRFREAMQDYVQGDYGTAIPELRAAAELDPKAPHSSFFLGACYLLTEQTEVAIEYLRRTVALGDSPYLEEAHFYSAKAYLRQGDLQAAQEELKKTIQLQGELESEARQLLRQLERLSKTLP